jgi:hypothetical protein
MLAASYASAATYLNDFGTSDPALQVSTAFADNAWNSDATYNNFNFTLLQKPWDVSVANGSISISGWASMPSSYFDTYPEAAGHIGKASFVASTTFNGLGGFRISDISSLSYRVTVGNLHSVPQEMSEFPPYLSLFLVTGSGTRTWILGGEANIAVSRSGVGDTGDYIFTYSDFLADPNNSQYVGIGFLSGAYFDSDSNVFPDQFIDLTFQSASINLVAVPEPSAYGIALGGIALAIVSRRRSGGKRACGRAFWQI